jgi:hypothetical protein
LTEEQSEIGDQEKAAQSNQSDAERRTQFTTPREILFGGHYGSKPKHPGHVADPDAEHQKHQRPATADAKNTMMHSQQKGISPLVPTAPVLSHES